MNVKVVDSSVVVGALVDDTVAGRHARNVVAEQRLSAPHLLDIEILAALRRMVRLGHIEGSRALSAIARLAKTPIARHDHARLLHRCWELRENVTPYDAAYVALAEALGVPLLTADARLANAPGIRCEVELLS